MSGAERRREDLAVDAEVDPERCGSRAARARLLAESCDRPRRVKWGAYRPAIERWEHLTQPHRRPRTPEPSVRRMADGPPRRLGVRRRHPPHRPAERPRQRCRVAAGRYAVDLLERNEIAA